MEEWTCGLCKDEMPEDQLLPHYRLMHPEIEIDDRVDSWPDGGIAAMDETLEPADFT